MEIIRSIIQKTMVIVGAWKNDCAKLCHLFCDVDNVNYEELEKIGVNNSVIHVDFMIGTKDLEITGINKNGETIQIFTNGNWVN